MLIKIYLKKSMLFLNIMQIMEMVVLLKWELPLFLLRILFILIWINDKSHRGVSDLAKSIFPAKLFTCLYISNTIALLTRGYDKRLYHVKQTVDTNITSVLLNVINQIKRSNFNLRQIENMNNILNVTGRFNDLVIPQNANGEISC